MADQGMQQRLAGKLEEVKGRVKEAYGALTDDDLAQTDGRWDQLVGTISQKTGESRPTVEQRLEQVLNALP